MKILRHTLFLTLINLTCLLNAQVITGLEYNPVIKKYLVDQNKLKSTESSSIFTPPFPKGNYFFDDFAHYRKAVYPNDSLWTDKYAFVNSFYADSLISLGVVTLDAVDETGSLYATSDAPFPSDTLTSKPIRLEKDTNTYYFSFFLQGGGKGDAPEPADSLFLEFLNPDTLQFIEVWALAGREMHSFEQVIIPIADSLVGDKFCFRFRNITSMKVGIAPGKTESALANCDFWHLDYIQIVKGKDPSVAIAVNDAAYTQVITPSLKSYYKIPYEHFQYSNRVRISSHTSVFQTMFPYYTNSIEIGRVYESFNIYKGKNETLNQESPAQNLIAPVSYEAWGDDFNPSYSYVKSQKYGHFLKRSYLQVADTNQYRWNDTSEIEEIYTDYYALDDGTAEFGFGIPGSGSEIMQFANYFEFFYSPDQVTDTLSAVDICFVHSRNNDHAGLEFTVCVWENENGKPGKLIYPEGNWTKDNWPRYSPDSTLGINEFMRIPFEKDLLVSDTLFIGFVQYGSGFLNLGYDINTDNKNKIRYNDGNGWKTPSNSLTAGTVMIRPVFDHKVFDAVPTLKVSEKTAELVIYPNPATHYISLKLADFTGNSLDYRLEVYDMYGKLVHAADRLLEQLDIEEFSPGLYLVRVMQTTNSTLYLQKFIKY